MKPHDHRFACAGKLKFPSWNAAALKAKQRRRNTDNGNLQPYHCPQCGMVHIGNNERTKGYRVQSKIRKQDELS